MNSHHAAASLLSRVATAAAACLITLVLFGWVSVGLTGDQAGAVLSQAFDHAAQPQGVAENALEETPVAF